MGISALWHAMHPAHGSVPISVGTSDVCRNYLSSFHVIEFIQYRVASSASRGNTITRLRVSMFSHGAQHTAMDSQLAGFDSPVQFGFATHIPIFD